jgi:hypothetical protein
VKALREVNQIIENEIIQNPQKGSEIKKIKKGKRSGYNK